MILPAVSHIPRTTPWQRRASIPNWLQLGSNRQRGGNHGEIPRWYPRMIVISTFTTIPRRGDSPAPLSPGEEQFKEISP